MAQGPRTRGAWGAGPPLELGIYKVKYLKTGKISFFLLHRGPLGKICSVAPAYAAYMLHVVYSNFQMYLCI